MRFVRGERRLLPAGSGCPRSPVCRGLFTLFRLFGFLGLLGFLLCHRALTPFLEAEVLTGYRLTAISLFLFGGLFLSLLGFLSFLLSQISSPPFLIIYVESFCDLLSENDDFFKRFDYASVVIYTALRWRLSGG